MTDYPNYQNNSIKLINIKAAHPAKEGRMQSLIDAFKDVESELSKNRLYNIKYKNINLYSLDGIALMLEFNDYKIRFAENNINIKFEGKYSTLDTMLMPLKVLWEKYPTISDYEELSILKLAFFNTIDLPNAPDSFSKKTIAKNYNTDLYTNFRQNIEIGDCVKFTQSSKAEFMYFHDTLSILCQTETKQSLEIIAENVKIATDFNISTSISPDDNNNLDFFLHLTRLKEVAKKVFLDNVTIKYWELLNATS